MASACLTVFGLAYDATEREVHVLFSGCTGYVRNIVVPGKTNAQKPYAFVQFNTHEEAVGAMETRMSTTWDSGLPPVAIEMAKRNIPDKFVPRQVVAPAPVAPVVWGPPQLAHGHGKGTHVPPPAKRARQDGGTWGQGKGGAGGGSRAAAAAQDWGTAAEEGPRTLHVGGLPPTLGQEDLDNYLLDAFGDNFVGCKLNTGGRSTVRAFVGFASHYAAEEALEQLNGMEFEPGCTLRAEWARTEFRNAGAAGAAAAAAPAVVAPPPTRAAGLMKPGASPFGTRKGGGKHGGGSGGGKNGGSAWGAAGAAAAGGGRRTLHFTNLPFVPEADVEQFLQATFPDQIVCINYKDTRDGRPPVAWVLFTEEAVAAEVASTYQTFDLEGKEVCVHFARTELDPSKVRSAKGHFS